MWKFLLLFFVSFHLLGTTYPQKLLPINDAPKDKSFLSFQERLKLAIKERDIAFIKSIISSDIKFTFGYAPDYKKDPIEAFIRFYKLESKESSFWKKLKRVIDLGCVKRGDNNFECPYVSANWPEDLDALDYVVALSKDTKIKEKPTDESKTLKTASFEILKKVPPWTKGSWHVVQISNGSKVGYVNENEVGSPIGYRAYFKKENGEWKLTVFIAGD